MKLKCCQFLMEKINGIDVAFGIIENIRSMQNWKKKTFFFHFNKTSIISLKLFLKKGHQVDIVITNYMTFIR